jgi:SAM-dependent methyltransferase
MISHSYAHHHDSIAELLDLDALVLHRYLSDILTWVHARATGRPPRRVLDVGAGTGTGTIALANYFPSADVVAVDMSAEMLHRVRDRAEAAGLEARIHDVLREVRTGFNDHPDWSGNLEHAGFTSVEMEAFSIDLAIDGDGIGGRYAQTYLRRVQPVVGPHLSTSDRTMLDALVADDGPLTLRRRNDLRMRAGRTVWVASRP